MEKLFGTDGIRGKANTHPITSELVLNIAKASAWYFVKNKLNTHNKVLIGKDTRASGDMIEASLCAGFTAMGFDVELAGVIPTPGLSYVTANSDADLAVMISASHNPYFDNGIKFFKGDGKKLSDAEQDEITSIFYNEDFKSFLCEPGRMFLCHEKFLNLYKELFKSYCGDQKILKGKKIVLDTANGACYEIAPIIFKELGAEVITIFNSPTGLNINENCGSEHTDVLCEKVVENLADFGLAFDGDGDRLIVVDDCGIRTTGDQIIALICEALIKKDKKPGVVVSTIMSNLGLRKYMEKSNIEHIQTKVGDRYVYEAMSDKNAKIGGEDSGHLIFMDYQNTGDGILSGIIFADLVLSLGQKISELKKIIKIYPQKLVNIDVNEKPEILSIKEIAESIQKAESILGEKGRVLVRYSGTQNMCRVMCEAETHDQADLICDLIGEAVIKTIGNSK